MKLLLPEDAPRHWHTPAQLVSSSYSAIDVELELTSKLNYHQVSLPGSIMSAPVTYYSHSTIST